MSIKQQTTDVPRKEHSETQQSSWLLSNLEEWTLLVMRNREMYGWEILKAMNVAGQGKRKMSFGSLYPTLHKLEKKEFVESWWGEEQPDDKNGPRKRFYKVTPLGQRALDETQEYRQALAASGSLIPASC
jgi:PadR family transcriptional regulator PadR